MSWYNKVIWSEGLFLTPQHFQQSDRYFEKLIRSRVKPLRSYPWGLTQLKLNRDMLALGKLAVDEALGVFEDGTPFSIPDDDDHPIPLDVPKTARQAIVYLAIPSQQPGRLEAASAHATETVARLAIAEQEINDVNAANRAEVGIAVGRLRMRLVLEGTDRADLICLAVGRIAEVRSDKHIVLDEGFIPPYLDCAASKTLSGFITELQGALHHRGTSIAGRVAEPSTKAVAAFSDVMLLQAINRYEPLLAHFRATECVHPESLYGVAVQLAGELATFLSQSKRPPDFPPYRHDDLATSFAAVMRSLRQSLSAEPELTAIPIQLRELRHGVHVAQINDKTLLTSATFVLSVKADYDSDRLRRFFPNQTKVGPIENIRELVNSALPGIAVRALAVAPRQIPFRRGNAYFELDPTSNFWKSMQTSGGLALHVAGEFPELELELWAIRGQ
jgi:type VI secretion system protein ImpJ